MTGRGCIGGGRLGEVTDGCGDGGGGGIGRRRSLGKEAARRSRGKAEAPDTAYATVGKSCGGAKGEASGVASGCAEGRVVD